MADLSSYLTNDHRRCDDEFVAAESAVGDGDWTGAQLRFGAFAQFTEHHFQMEEEVLFPAFEQATGMVAGPTQVMRMEHQQMRQLMHDMNVSLSQQNRQRYLGLSETMLMIMQQHNMKEEQMLYRMADQALAGQQDALIEKMSAV